MLSSGCRAPANDEDYQSCSAAIRHSDAGGFEPASSRTRSANSNNKLVRTRSKQELGAKGANLRHKWRSIGVLGSEEEPALLQRGKLQVSDGFERLRKSYASMRKSFRLQTNTGSRTRFDCQRASAASEQYYSNDAYGNQQETRKSNLIGQIGHSAAKLLRGVVYSPHSRGAHNQQDSIETSTNGSFKVLSSMSQYGELGAGQRAQRKSEAELEIEHRLRRSKRRVLPSASYQAPNSELACEGLNMDELEAIKRDNLRLTLRSQKVNLISGSSESLSGEQGWTAKNSDGPPERDDEIPVCSCTNLNCANNNDRQEMSAIYCSCASFSSSFSSIHKLFELGDDSDICEGGEQTMDEIRMHKKEEFQEEKAAATDLAEEIPSRASGGSVVGDTMIEDKLRKMFHSLGEFKFAHYNDNIESDALENDIKETIFGEATAETRTTKPTGGRMGEQDESRTFSEKGDAKEDLDEGEGSRLATLDCGGQNLQVATTTTTAAKQIRLAVAAAASASDANTKCGYEQPESDADRAAHNCCPSLGGVTLAQIASQQVSNSLHCSPVNDDDDDDPDENDCSNDDATGLKMTRTDSGGQSEKTARANSHAIEPVNGSGCEQQAAANRRPESVCCGSVEFNVTKLQAEENEPRLIEYHHNHKGKSATKQVEHDNERHQKVTGNRGSSEVESRKTMSSFTKAEVWRRQEEAEEEERCELASARRRHLELCRLSEQLRGQNQRKMMFATHQEDSSHLYASINGSETPSPEDYNLAMCEDTWADTNASYPQQFLCHDKHDLFSKQLEDEQQVQRKQQEQHQIKNNKSKKSLFSRLKNFIGQPNNGKTTAKGQVRQTDANRQNVDDSDGRANKTFGWHKSATLRSKSTQNLLGHSLRYLSSSRKSINLIGSQGNEDEGEEGCQNGRMINSGFLTLGRRLRTNERCNSIARQEIINQLRCEGNSSHYNRHGGAGRVAIERHYWGSADSLPSADSGLSCGNLQNSSSSDENYAALHQAARAVGGNLYTENPSERLDREAGMLQVVGRARAKVDCNPCAYDKEALVFKQGDIIDIIERHQSGTWLGRCGSQVGHFKFINVVEIKAECNGDLLDEDHDDVVVEEDESTSVHRGSLTRQSGKGTFVTKLEIRSGNATRESDKGIHKTSNSASTAAVVVDSGNEPINAPLPPQSTINRRSLSMNTISYSSSPVEPGGSALSKKTTTEEEGDQKAAPNLSGSNETIMSSLEQLLYAIGLAGEQVRGNGGSCQANTNTKAAVATKTTTTTTTTTTSEEQQEQQIGGNKSVADLNHSNPLRELNSTSYLDVLNKGGISSLDSFSAIDDCQELEQIGIVDDEHKRRLLMAARIIRQASRAAKLDFVENYRPGKDAIRSADSSGQQRLNEQKSKRREGERDGGRLSLKQARSGHINEPIYVNLVAVNRRSGSAESIVSQLDRVQDLDLVYVKQNGLERGTSGNQCEDRLSAVHGGQVADCHSLGLHAGRALDGQTKQQHRHQQRLSHATTEQKGNVLNPNLINQFDHYHSRYLSIQNQAPHIGQVGCGSQNNHDWNDDEDLLDDHQLGGDCELARGYSVRVNSNSKLNNSSKRRLNHSTDLECCPGQRVVVKPELTKGTTLVARLSNKNSQRDEEDSRWTQAAVSGCDGAGGGTRLTARVSTDCYNRLAAGDKRSGFDCNGTPLKLNADLDPRSEFSRREQYHHHHHYQYQQKQQQQQHHHQELLLQQQRLKNHQQHDYSAVTRIPTASRHFKQVRNASRQDNQKASFNLGSQINNSKSAYDLRLDLSHFFY